MRPLSAQLKLKLIKRVLAGEKVARVSRETGIARKTFYAWLKKYKKTKPNVAHYALSDRRFKKRYTVHCLDPKERLLIINQADFHEDSIAKLCRNFGISRKTFYKWLVRYQKAGENGLVDSRPRGRNHPRFITLEAEKALLDFVAANPVYSVHKLYKEFNKEVLRLRSGLRLRGRSDSRRSAILPASGSAIGHHGIQNVLGRKGLNTYQTRLLFAKQYQTAPAVKISPLYVPTIPVYKWRMLFAPFKTVPKLLLTKPIAGILTTLAIFLPLTLIFLWLSSIVGAPAGSSTVGFIFSSLALFFWFFFFLYSMKYYISVLLVLKMAQGGGGEQ